MSLKISLKILNHPGKAFMTEAFSVRTIRIYYTAKLCDRNYIKYLKSHTSLILDNPLLCGRKRFIGWPR